MKKILSLIVLFAMMLSSMSVLAFADDGDVTGMIIYVAPDGDDSNDGETIEKPLATLKGARDRVRAIKNELGGVPTNGITVLFRGGEYFWTENVEFTKEDSGTADAPVRYSAYPGEEPCFTGGHRISGSEFSKVTDEETLARLRGGQATRENVRQINIRDYYQKFKEDHNLGETKIPDWYPFAYDVMSTSYGNYDSFKVNGKNSAYKQHLQDQLYEYGEENMTGTIRYPVFSIGDSPALWSARYPNKEVSEYGSEENPYPVYMKMGAVLQSPWTVNPTDYSLTGIFKYDDDRISRYADYDDVWLEHFSTIFYHDWIRIKDIDVENKTIETAYRPSHSFREGSDFTVFNILEELDSPGEMYIDKKTGIMYIYPNGDLDNSYLNIGVFKGEYMIRTTNTSFMSFNGISIENTQGSAILVDGGDSVEINYCNIRNIGNSAIQLGASYTTGKVRYWQLANEWRHNSAHANESYDDLIMEYFNFYSDPARGVDALGKNHKVYSSQIKNMGLSGISLTGGNSWRDEECNYVIDNCSISYVGIYKPTYECMISCNNAFGVKITNNYLAHAPGQILTGYLLKGEIAYNYFYDAMSVMIDNAMIYLNYTVMGLDIDFHNNWFRQIPEDDHVAPYHTQRFGIYFDDGVTQGLKIRDNIFQDMPSAFQKPVVNSDVTGNIFIECVDLHSKYGVAMKSTNILFMYPAVETENFYQSEANVAMANTLPAGSREWDYILALLPVNATFTGEDALAKLEEDGASVSDEHREYLLSIGNVGEHYRKLWREKYPRIMNYLDILESQEHKGNFFVNVQNNLIVKRERKDWWANGFKFEDIEEYQASGCAIKNNVYVDNNDCFVDYANEDFTLKEDFAKKYNLSSIDQSEIGLRTDVVGTELYKKVVTKLPAVSSVYTPKTEKADLSAVENAVVLKIGESKALAGGEAVSIDSENENVTPVIIDSRTLVPVRFIAENLGGEVSFDDETQKITILLDGKTVELTLGEKEIYIDGELAATSDVAAQSIEGRTMIPLRVICESVFGKKVYWDNSGVIIIGDEEISVSDELISAISNELQ